jgi:hypothetical protein
MNNKPREHHFVPRFWQKRFSPNGTVIVWAYDHASGKLEQRSSKVTMKQYDLYTVDPSAMVDVSLEENELKFIDDAGSKLLSAIIEGGDRSEVSRRALAEFLSVSVVRTPKMVERYNKLTQELVLQLIEAPHSPDYQTFIKRVRELGHPGIDLSEADFKVLTKVPKSDLELWIDDRLSKLSQPGGDPDIPFADAIRASSGRSVIQNLLLQLKWTIVEAPSGGLLLGDMGPVYEHADLSSGFRAPLSPTVAVVGVPVANPTPGLHSDTWQAHEVASLNFESAARATRWLVASRKEDLEPFAVQLAKS